MPDLVAVPGRCLIIATVMERDAAAIDAAIEEVARLGADAAEVRLDAAPGLAVEAIGRSARIPLIAACRARRDGGAFDASEEARVGLLERAARTGRFRLDVEHGTAAESLARERPESVAILSHHEIGEGPERLASAEGRRLQGRVRAMLAALGPNRIAKVVTAARLAPAALAVRDLLREAGDPRLAAFCMGDGGAPSRILSGLWGSAALWAAARAGAPGAPGQIGLAALLHRYRFRRLTPATRRFAVAGHPVSLSLSPAMHNEVFARAGIDGVYLPLECGTLEDLARLADELHLEGISVTAPLKVAALEAAGTLDPLARRAESCNTLVREGEAREARRAGEGASAEAVDAVRDSGDSSRWIAAAADRREDRPVRDGDNGAGANANRRADPERSEGGSRSAAQALAAYAGFSTDGEAALEEIRLRVDPRGREVVIVGAGGAARAVARALADAGARLLIASRDRAKGERLAALVGGEAVGLGGLAADSRRIVLQTASAPLDDPVVPEAALRATFVLDLRYGPSLPATVAAARRAGTDAADGRGVLARQGAAQARLFLRRAIPLEWLEAGRRGGVRELGWTEAEDLS